MRSWTCLDPRRPAPLPTRARFCISAQTRITGSQSLATNTVYTDYRA